MPLKIRCPHCQHILVARDEDAGEPRPCPACGQVFSVPLPRAATDVDAPPATPLPHCLRCGAELPVTATYCYRCHTDLKTGQRLPWRQRVRLLSWRGRLLTGLGLAALALAAIVGVQLYRILTRPGQRTFTPVAPQPIPEAQLADRLLGAKDAAECQTALAALRGIEQRVAPAVAAALRAAPPPAAFDPQAGANVAAAIELLIRHADAYPAARAEWCNTLALCTAGNTAHDAALWARARLGDARVLDELAALWLDRLKRDLLLARLTDVSKSATSAAAVLVTTAATDELTRLSDGLRVLLRAASAGVFERLAETYWESWNWLGQGRGDRFAERVFALTKSPGTRPEPKPEEARDALQRAAERGSPAARAALGLILAQCVPPYQSLSRTIGEALGGCLADAAPADQQRLIYASARLRGNVYGSVPREHPLDVTADEIAAAWKRTRPDAAPPSGADYPAPPLLIYRVTTADRLLEQDLLAEMNRDWASAAHAVETWRTAGLGLTPRLRDLLSPGQRRPEYPALAAALVIAAETHDTTVRPQIELWREAAEQPTWVRALAYVVVGSFDAQTGRWDSRWPANWDLGDPAVIEAGPGWEVFGRVLAAGGQNMLDRLANAAPTTLPAAIKAKLMEAAHWSDGKPQRPRGTEKSSGTGRQKTGNR